MDSGKNPNPSLPERIRACDSFCRRLRWIGLPLLAAGYFLLMNPVIGVPVREYDFGHYALLSGVIVWFVGLYWLGRKLRKNRIHHLGLICPDCGLELVGFRGRDAVTYHVCGQCGRSLADLAGPAPEEAAGTKI